jgi:hypothetical protein
MNPVPFELLASLFTGLYVCLTRCLFLLTPEHAKRTALVFAV